MLIAIFAQRFFKSKGAVKGLNRVSGSIMTGAGSYLALRG
jgi:threonine/homoserine/homoserine lactone efflux protein